MIFLKNCDINFLPMRNEPFYADGLKFSCKRCSACCRYDAGFVFLSEKDMNNLTSALNMKRNEVIKTYCRWVGDWKGDDVLSLREKSNKDCILWDDGCKVYNMRPLQCITFPFWESVVSSKGAWEIAAASCPGINSGSLRSKQAIEEDIRLRSLEPIICKTGSNL